MVRAMECTLYSDGFIQPSKKSVGGQREGGYPGLVKLESSLLSLAALGNVSQGVLYFLPVELADHFMVR